MKLPNRNLLKVHIAIGQYEFVEFDADSPIEAQEYSDMIKAAFVPKQPQVGLGRKEWNECLDALNMGLDCKIEAFEAMSPKQREFYHEQEKSIARIKNKQGGIIEE